MAWLESTGRPRGCWRWPAGTALVGVAYAQTPTATPTREQKAEEHLNRFAQNLGVDPARVREAMKQTALQHLNEAVAAGRITPEQAQAMRDRLNSGQFGPGMFGLGFGGHGGGRHGGMERGFGGLKAGIGAAQQELAGFFGVTPEALRTELNGKSLAQVATAHGKSADELKAFIVSAAERRLNEAVASTKIDQARATQALELVKANLDVAINHVHQEGMFGPGMRGPRGQFAPQATAIPSGT